MFSSIITAMITLFLSSSAFNVDDRKIALDIIHLREGKEDPTGSTYAGYSFVVTREEDLIRIVAGAPKQASSKGEEGAIYKCFATVNTSLESFHTSDWLTEPACDVLLNGSVISTGRNHRRYSGNLGATLTLNEANQFTACAPNREKQCGSDNIYVPGACYTGQLHEGLKMLSGWGEINCFQTFLDIVFVIDSSYSISDGDFQLMKNILINVTTVFQQSIGKATQIGILQYGNKNDNLNDSTTYPNPTKMGDCDDIQCVHDAINKSMEHLKASNTYTANALLRTVKVDFEQSKNKDVAKKVLILITDGAANDWPDLPESYNLTSQNNITVYALGVGEKVNEGQLRISANGGASNERVLKAGDFQELSLRLENLTSQISKVSVEGTSDSTITLENAQLGMSAYVSNQTGDLFLGAVGAYSWSGTVIKQSQVNGVTEDLSYSQVETLLKNKAKNSYLGYAVTSGNYNGGDDVFVAAGAPRHLFRGCVVVYPSRRNSSSTDELVITPFQNDSTSSSYEQSGSYFGASLLSVDVNGDGIDDLLIGAPMYSGSHYDEGRVFVYITNGIILYERWDPLKYQPVVLSGEMKKGGRFGTAMASAGDLNNDRYNDVIIAAPYAESGKGVVYIYHGSREGLVTEVKQVIRASDILFPNLRNFGLSLQGGVDLDGNQYPDVVIGAPKDETLVILRTRAVAESNVTLRFINDTVDIFKCSEEANRQCIQVEVCFLLYGKSVEESLELGYSISVEDGLRRVEFRRNPNETSSGFHSTTGEVVVERGVWKCHSYPLFIKRTIKDFSTNLQATLTYFLTSSHVEKPLSSLLAPSQTITTMGRFEVNCGSDGVCLDDLRVEGFVDLPQISVTKENGAQLDLSDGGRTLIVAEETANQFIIIKGNLTNAGEHAFGVRVTVTYPMQLQWIKAENTRSSDVDSSVCMDDRSAASTDGEMKRKVLTHSYNQQLGAILPTEQWCYFEIRFSFHQMRTKSDKGSLSIFMGAASTSLREEELNNTSKQWNVSIPVKYRADARLTRLSTERVVTFHFTDVNSTVTKVAQVGAGTPDVTMQYQIENLGFSSIPRSSFSLTYPSMLTTIHPLLYLYKVECEPKRGNPDCMCQQHSINKYNLSTSPDALDRANSIDVIANPIPVKEILFNCSEYNANHLCDSLRCDVTALHASNALTLTATFRLWTQTLNLQNESEVILRSNFAFSLENSPHVVDRHGNNGTQTAFKVDVIAQPYKEIASAPVQNLVWFGVAGAGGGLLLLFASAMVMWKVGFFKNQYYDVQQQHGRRSEGEVGGMFNDALQTTPVVIGGSDDVKILSTFRKSST